MQSGRIVEDELHASAQALADAEAIQRELAPLVELRPLRKLPRTIAAVDADYHQNLTFAAALLFHYDSCARPFETRVAVRPTDFPYLPGFFSLREAPAALEAVTAFSQAPGAILVDGQGIAHPRGFGVACHIGVLTGLPTIGCAKSRLLGSFREPGRERGDWSPLVVEGRTVGAVLRTQTGVKPVFVSPGHLVTLKDCIEIVLHCSPHYRVPEPLRMADAAARAARREWLAKSTEE